MKAYAPNSIFFAVIVSIGIAAALITVSPEIEVVAAGGELPAVQQNALVAKYCTVCHTDAHPQRRPLARTFRRRLSRSGTGGDAGQ